MEEDGTKSYWQTLRTFSSKTGESGIPATSGFIDLDWSGDLPDEVEVRFDAITTTGSPTAILFDVWRLLDSKIDRIYRITFDAADLTAPIPTNLKFDASQIYITCSFTGGTAPTVSTVSHVRVIK